MITKTPFLRQRGGVFYFFDPVKSIPVKQKWTGFTTIDALLRFVESNLEEAFFPTIDPIKINETQRRKGIQDLLNSFAPKMTIKELFEGADPEKVGLPILK
jgi:hypothetical protein